MIRFSANTRAKRDIFRRTQAVGIIASVPEIDTVSASIALANYYRSAKGCRTALAITGDDTGFMEMLSGAECIDIDPAGYDDGILVYYILKNRIDLEKIIEKGYDRIVMNFGIGSDRFATEELLMMDRIAAFISTSDWRCRNTREFLFSTLTSEKRLRQRFKNTAYTVAGRAEMNRTIGKEFGIAIKSIRDIISISDPYRLTKEDLRVISKFA